MTSPGGRPGTRELRVGLAGPRLDGPQPPPDPGRPRRHPARGRRRSRSRPRSRGATAQTGAQGFAEPLAMIAEAELDARRHRRPDDRPRAARPRRDRARHRRSSSRSRSRPRSTRRCGSSPRRARARRPGPGRPRRAVQPGRARARPAARRPAGCRRSTRSPSRRAGPFPARIRDVGVTVDLATHDVDILSLDRRRAAVAGLRRDGPADPRRRTRTSSSGCSTSRPARPACSTSTG